MEAQHRRDYSKQNCNNWRSLFFLEGVDLANYHTLDCNLAKCLVLGAICRRKKLINDDELTEVKKFLLSDIEAAKLSYTVRSFEEDYSLLTFRSEVASFMGTHSLGLRVFKLANPNKAVTLEESLFTTSFLVELTD